MGHQGVFSPATVMQAVGLALLSETGTQQGWGYLLLSMNVRTYICMYIICMWHSHVVRVLKMLLLMVTLTTKEAHGAKPIDSLHQSGKQSNM